MSDEMRLDGFEDLDKKLALLPQKVSKDIVRKGTRVGANTILPKIKSNAKSMIGGKMGSLIAEKAAIIVFKHQRKGSYGVQIGMKANVPEFDYWAVGASSSLKSRRTIGKKSYIPAALEYGHGNGRPIPYIRAAWESSKAKAVLNMKKYFKQEIERAGKL